MWDTTSLKALTDIVCNVFSFFKIKKHFKLGSNQTLQIYNSKYIPFQPEIQFYTISNYNTISTTFYNTMYVTII